MAQLEFKDIPVTALSSDTTHTLSLLLSPKKVLQSAEGLPRDWRGLACLSGIPGEYTPAIGDNPDPTREFLHLWSKMRIEDANFECLQIFLEKIDRYDVLNDIEHSLEKDAAQYIQKCKLGQQKIPPESHMITIDDVNNGCIQTYNGLLLFSDHDYEFACYVIREMEQFGLKLCVKDRDLLGGIRSEHGAVLQLLVERCARLVVILSPEFLGSPENSFFIDYAQALGINQGRRKIVPVLYKQCETTQLRFFHMLDYQRSVKFQLYDFWEKLRLSIQGTPLHLSEEHTYGEEQKEKPGAHIGSWKGNGLDRAHGHTLKNQVTIREFDGKIPPTPKFFKSIARSVPSIAVTASSVSNGAAKVPALEYDSMSSSLLNMSALSIEDVNNIEGSSISLPNSAVLERYARKKKSKFKKFKKMVREKLSLQKK